MEDERLLRFAKLLYENGLEERVILALEVIPELALLAADCLNKHRATGFRRPVKKRLSEDEVLRAVDQLAATGKRVTFSSLATFLGLRHPSLYQRASNNPAFGKRLKAKIDSLKD